MDPTRSALLEVVRRGLRRLDEPIQLASGGSSRDFIDGKECLAHGRDLELACRAIVELAAAEEVAFDAVGGLTMGADQFAHGVAIVAGVDWFVVRKEPKGRGTNRLVEGRQLGAGDRVLLVEDVVSTGGSALKALDTIRELGATVVLATALVDRGDAAARSFAERGVRYRPLFTYHDLGIEPIA